MANILIADDQKSYRQLLGLVFKESGYDIRKAKNGREALELLETKPSEIIISDVRMPDMDGITLLRKTREILPDVGIIFDDGFCNCRYRQRGFYSRRR